MNSLEHRFNLIQKKNPLWSSLVCFHQTIVNRRLTERSISENFSRLVDKDDYSRKDKGAILKQLCDNIKK